MFLEIATTVGALSGAIAAMSQRTDSPSSSAVVLLVPVEPSHDHAAKTSRPTNGAALRLDSTYPTPRAAGYRVQRVPAGFGLMYGAGVLSGLLGIGRGGKVLAMDPAMRLPFKVRRRRAIS